MGWNILKIQENMLILLIRCVGIPELIRVASRFLSPEKMRDRLFDPMVSVGKRKASQSRLGLGLYVVRLIAEFHGGAVSAKKRADTPGVAVTMRLPLARA